MRNLQVRILNSDVDAQCLIGVILLTLAKFWFAILSIFATNALMALCNPSSQPHVRERQQVDDWSATITDLGFFCRHLLVRLARPNNKLSGQTIVVTSSNIGPGLEIAPYFTRCNAAKAIEAVRSTGKRGEAKSLIEEPPRFNEVVEVWQPYVGSYESCQANHHRRRKVWLGWTLSCRMLEL